MASLHGLLIQSQASYSLDDSGVAAVDRRTTGSLSLATSACGRDPQLAPRSTNAGYRRRQFRLVIGGAAGSRTLTRPIKSRLYCLTNTPAPEIGARGEIRTPNLSALDRVPLLVGLRERKIGSRDGTRTR
jgi:hypothetical protein